MTISENNFSNHSTNRTLIADFGCNCIDDDGDDVIAVVVVVAVVLVAIIIDWSDINIPFIDVVRKFDTCRIGVVVNIIVLLCNWEFFITGVAVVVAIFGTKSADVITTDWSFVDDDAADDWDDDVKINEFFIRKKQKKKKKKREGEG